MRHDWFALSYFVLDPQGDDVYARASRNALLEFASSIRLAKPDLADAIAAWVEREKTLAGEKP